VTAFTYTYTYTYACTYSKTAGLAILFVLNYLMNAHLSSSFFHFLSVELFGHFVLFYLNFNFLNIFGQAFLISILINFIFD
jgi:hypothetical protein